MDTHNLWGLSFEGAIFVVLCIAIAAGTLGGVIRGWSILSRLYSLEDRVAVAEGTLLREVKTRAGQERWKRPDKDVMAVDQNLLKQQAPPVNVFASHLHNLPRSYDGH
jgi:hypothetical protein